MSVVSTRKNVRKAGKIASVNDGGETVVGEVGPNNSEEVVTWDLRKRPSWVPADRGVIPDIREVGSLTVVSRQFIQGTYATHYVFRIRGGGGQQQGALRKKCGRFPLSVQQGEKANFQLVGNNLRYTETAKDSKEKSGCFAV